MDALCIVQDDLNEQDWYEQSLQMGSIYSNAHLVISVDGASCCTDGFLPREENYSWKTVHRQPSEDSGNSEVIRLARKMDGSERRLRSYDTFSLHSEPLSQRGWTMQECILPRRILHFTEKELIWECSTNCECQCRKTYSHNLWKHHDYNLINDPRIRHNDENRGFSVHIDDFLRGRTVQSTCWIWERLIEQYSRRFLTLPSDKIAAISGLAKLFQKTLHVSPTDYLAGLWKIDLPICLLWYVTGSPPPSRPEEWRAPTWSWASIDGGVGFFNERYQFSFKSHVRVGECFCDPMSVDPFGKVRKARIKIVGDLVPVILEVKATSAAAYDGQFVGSCGKPPKAFEDIIATVCAGGESYEILPDLRLECGTYNTCAEDYFCLHLGNTFSLLKAGERCWWLVLHRIVGASDEGDFFRRIGIGSFDSSSRVVDMFPKAAGYGAEVILI